MNEITFTEWLTQTNRIWETVEKGYGLRYGQTLFNELHFLHPELADSLRGGDSDCFYDSEKVMNFLYVVKSRWPKKGKVNT